MPRWGYITLAILVLLIILFFTASLILTFVTDIVEPGARPGIIIFWVVTTPPLVIGLVILVRELNKTNKAKS